MKGWLIFAAGVGWGLTLGVLFHIFVWDQME